MVLNANGKMFRNNLTESSKKNPIFDVSSNFHNDKDNIEYRIGRTKLTLILRFKYQIDTQKESFLPFYLSQNADIAYRF